MQSFSRFVRSSPNIVRSRERQRPCKSQRTQKDANPHENCRICKETGKAKLKQEGQGVNDTELVESHAELFEICAEFSEYCTE